MNDDPLLRELRDAARRADAAPLPPALERPLGAIEQEQIARRILASRPALPKPARARALYGMSALGFAAAAAFAFFALRPVHAPVGDALPSYSITLTGGADTDRAAPATKADLTGRARAPMTVLLRPSTQISGTLAAHAFAVRGGVVSDSKAALKVSANGSVQAQGTLGELVGDGAGDAQFVVVVQRAGDTKPARDLVQSDAVATDAYVAKVPAHVLP